MMRLQQHQQVSQLFRSARCFSTLSLYSPAEKVCFSNGTKVIYKCTDEQKSIGSNKKVIDGALVASHAFLFYKLVWFTTWSPVLLTAACLLPVYNMRGNIQANSDNTVRQLELLQTGDLLKVTYVSGLVQTLAISSLKKVSEDQMQTIKEETGPIFQKYMTDVTPVLIVPDAEQEHDTSAITSGKVAMLILDNKASIPDKELLTAVCSGMDIEVDTIRKPRLAAIDI